MATADNAGTEIHYEVSGEGVPVVLLHGFPDSGHLWRHQVPALTGAGYRVIVPDMRGYGRSARPVEVDAYDIPRLVSDVGAVLADAGVPRAHVVGHDWGAAAVGAGFSGARHRRPAGGPVGRASGHVQGPPGSAGSRSAREVVVHAALPVPGCGRGVAVREPVGQLPDPLPSSGRRQGDRRSRSDSSLTPGLNYFRAIVNPESFLGPPPALPPVQAPTLGVWSSGDFALTEAQMTRSAEHVAGPWQYARLEGPGHWMQVEAPDRVNALLLDFLTRSSPSRVISAGPCRGATLRSLNPPPPG